MTVKMRTAAQQQIFEAAHMRYLAIDYGARMSDKDTVEFARWREHLYDLCGRVRFAQVDGGTTERSTWLKM